MANLPLSTIIHDLLPDEKPKVAFPASGIDFFVVCDRMKEAI
jgi:hypothetical protein